MITEKRRPAWSDGLALAGRIRLYKDLSGRGGEGHLAWQSFTGRARKTAGSAAGSKGTYFGRLDVQFNEQD